MSSRPTIRVYVDGQNLFRRALKGTPYLWLDVVRLCQEVLPRYEVVKVRYFTAEVRPTPHDPHVGERQRSYLRALTCEQRLSVHLGHFRRDVVRMPVHPWVHGADGHPIKVTVKRTIEKGSDVNLATHLLWDALHGEADAYAVVSDDSDLAMPVRMLRERGDVDVGVMFPSHEPARLLLASSAWFRTIRPSALARSQFPERVVLPGGEHAIKPQEW